MQKKKLKNDFKKIIKNIPNQKIAGDLKLWFFREFYDLLCKYLLICIASNLVSKEMFFGDDFERVLKIFQNIFWRVFETFGSVNSNSQRTLIISLNGVL